jgi:hypothetical protein
MEERICFYHLLVILGSGLLLPVSCHGKGRDLQHVLFKLVQCGVRVDMKVFERDCGLVRQG